MPPVDESADGASLYAPFRPRRGRLTAIWVGLAQAALFIAVVIASFAEPRLGFQLGDRVGMLSVCAAIGVLLWRFARLAVLVDTGGLTVRNLAGEQRLEWAQVVTVRFGGGQPWVTLDLADGEVLAVMAIQRADGPRSESEARRLATLVALHTGVS